jgi:hypothetical protein
MRPDENAVARILAAMRLAPGGESIDTSAVDPEVLLRDLSDEFRLQQFATELPRVHEKRSQRSAKIQRTARALARLLKEERADLGRIRHYPLRDPDPRRVALKVALAARATREPTQEPIWATEAATALVKDLNARSRFDCLVGELLSPLFNRYFPGNLAEYTTDSTDPLGDVTDSPKVRFIEAALREFGFTHRGKPHSRKSIASAITNAKTGRRRRKDR